MKTIRFAKPRYVGDPINVVRMFNDKHADELVLLDIAATADKRQPDLGLLGEVASEAFMPVSYGGGITDLACIERLLALGIEKVVLRGAAERNPEFVREAARAFGSSTVVVSLDVRLTLLKRPTTNFTNPAGKALDPVSAAKLAEEAGAGEILMQAVYRDGTMAGLDHDLIARVANQVTVPVVACGGARSPEDLAKAIGVSGASAVAAGSLFVYSGPHRAVLISYPYSKTVECLEIYEQGRPYPQS